MGRHSKKNWEWTSISEFHVNSPHIIDWTLDIVDGKIASSADPNQGCVLEKIIYIKLSVNWSGGGKITKYFGETARTGFDWGVEHLNNFRTGENGHFIFKHQRATGHLDFSIGIVRSHPYQHYRQSHEKSWPHLTVRRNPQCWPIQCINIHPFISKH